MVNKDMRQRLEEIRALARTGLPPTMAGYTQEQWESHKLSSIAGELTALINELQEEEDTISQQERDNDALFQQDKAREKQWYQNKEDPEE